MQSRRRASVVCVFEHKLLLVRLEDPLSKVSRLFPPGGKIEVGETPAQAAVRETLEETGYRVEVKPESELQKRYPFHWAGKTYDCRTYFYRAHLLSPKPVTVSDSSYLQGVEWVGVEKALEALSFDLSIQEAVEKLSNISTV